MSTGRWDDLLSNSTWYVPAANLLAFRLDSESPDTPIAASDQTLWSIGAAAEGRFTGRSVARIVDADGGETESLAKMQGQVSRQGQVRITFTTPVGSTITGIGQVRRVTGQPAMEMQMITGGGGAYTTHWAYMLRASEGTTPPDPAHSAGEQKDERSSAYRWLLGTTWSITPRGGPRSTPEGRFTISGYRNGYLWGSGTSDSGRGSFEVLGSVTPEGNLFFNAIGSEDFNLRISQGGMLLGSRRAAEARLHPYDAVTGQLELPLQLSLLPEPRTPARAWAPAEPLIEGGERDGEARRGDGSPASALALIRMIERTAELASASPQAWPATPPLSGIRGLDSTPAPWDGALEALLQGGAGSIWPG